MQHLFLPPDQICGDTARIIGPDHLHLARVLRARPGEKVVLLDNAGNVFRAVLVNICKAETLAHIEARIALPPEPPVFITVAQALGKSEKFEQVVQHGTEAGASAFIPIRAERCIADVPADKVAQRMARWQQIAKGAAEQSGRTRIAEVSLPISFGQLMRETADTQTPALLLHPTDAVPLHACLEGIGMSPARLLLAVGPEGGWSQAEVSAAQTANLIPVTLGPRILRTEVAALVAISQILYHFERLERE